MSSNTLRDLDVDTNNVLHNTCVWLLGIYPIYTLTVNILHTHTHAPTQCNAGFELVHCLHREDLPLIKDSKPQRRGSVDLCCLHERLCAPMVVQIFCVDAWNRHGIIHFSFFFLLISTSQQEHTKITTWATCLWVLLPKILQHVITPWYHNMTHIIGSRTHPCKAWRRCRRKCDKSKSTGSYKKY